LNAFQNLIKKTNLNIFKKCCKRKTKNKLEKKKGKRKQRKEKRNKEKGKRTKKQKRKKNEKKIADQVGANGPAHTARGGVRRGTSTDLVGA
jgi:hypothetical protein